MYIKVSDIFSLKTLKQFTLMAGESGLTNEVNSVCLADFELDRENNSYSNTVKKGSVVIASMRDKELLENYTLLDIFGYLKRKEVAALVFNDQMVALSSKDIEFCNKHALPIYGYNPKEVYIESVVYEIMQTLLEGNSIVSKEREVEALIRGNITRKDVKILATAINPDLMRNCTVSYIRGKEVNDEFSPNRVMRGYNPGTESDDYVVGLAAYSDGLFMIVSMNRMNIRKRDAIIDTVLKDYVDFNEVIIASSSEHSTFDELDIAFKECHHTFITASIEGAKRMDYENIGTYRFLIPNIHSTEESDFMKKYLRNMSDEQLETAIVFVRCNGSYDDAAKELVCHRNTVRYRINKIHDKTDPGKSELQFYENLSAAVKIYLISGMF